MAAVRMNITIPEDLARQMDRLIGPRRKSRFIAETLRQKVEEIQQKRLDKTLEEGYKARAEESRIMAKEFESVDLEGWDEY